MFNFDFITKEDIKEHNPKWPDISDHLHRILIIGSSVSGETNALLNLISYEPDIYEIYLYSNDIDDIYKNIEEYNPSKKRKILIVFDDIIICDYMLSNKKINPIVTELFIRGRKLNISLIFIMQSYLAVPKNIRLKSTHHFLMKIPNRRELQQIAFNHSLDIDFQDFVNLYQKFTEKQYPFLVIDTTLASDIPICFRKNLLEKI